MFFPRVLIIGETFHKRSGGGITLLNLFSNWPKENIAVVSTHKTIVKTDSNYHYIPIYQLGTDEIRPKFPLNLLQQKYYSGRYIFNVDYNKKGMSKTPIHFNGNIKKLIDKLFSSFGLYFLLSRTLPSKRLYDFISEFKPDIIYTQLSTLELIRFVSIISNNLKVPLAIHIMDDWPKYLPDKCIIFKKYWEKIIDKELRKLFNEAKFLFSISEGMSREYLQRYGREFIPFHNPIDLNKWLPYSKKEWGKNNPYKILYTGRIGLANSNSLHTICKAIDYIFLKYSINITFKIYANNFDPKNVKYFEKKYKRVKVFPPVNYESMPKLLSSADLLILPLDFDKKSIQFARLSMPTKATEYMISGTPTIVFADSKTFLSEHAKKNEWAIVINENNYKILASKILDLYNNEELRKHISKNAKNFAIKNYDIQKVTKEFYEKLIQ
ncbi:glycosyltransferase [Rosettibacter firmus]|uniref:glycosyltransferase n=1 Tax=Rosettibacter firmus TaxID=3111522 RepID=UPI00336C25AE